MVETRGRTVKHVTTIYNSRCPSVFTVFMEYRQIWNLHMNELNEWKCF